MSDKDVRRIVKDCQGMSDEEIIEAFHGEYFDEDKPHVRAALGKLGIDEWEVTEWVRVNIK